MEWKEGRICLSISAPHIFFCFFGFPCEHNSILSEMKRRAIVSSLFLIALLALSGEVKAQCTQTCSGATPICNSNTNNCVPCTTQAQCWSASGNSLSCDLVSGECKTCNTSSTCPEQKPICSTVTSTCTTCNATAECAIRLSGSVCDTNLGTCGWCTSDAECASYGPGSVCTNITSTVRKCSIPIIPPMGIPGAPDPNNINGLIMAYTIISIVIFLIFVMFVVCGTYLPFDGKFRI